MKALNSPPTASIADAMSSAERVAVPLNSRCSRKWLVPASAGRLVARPDRHPDADADAAHAGHRLGDDPQARRAARCGDGRRRRSASSRRVTRARGLIGRAMGHPRSLRAHRRRADQFGGRAHRFGRGYRIGRGHRPGVGCGIGSGVRHRHAVSVSVRGTVGATVHAGHTPVDAHRTGRAVYLALRSRPAVSGAARRPGSATIRSTCAGSLPASTWARVVSSSTRRRLARTATQTSGRCSATPA